MVCLTQSDNHDVLVEVRRNEKMEVELHNRKEKKMSKDNRNKNEELLSQTHTHTHTHTHSYSPYPLPHSLHTPSISIHILSLSTQVMGILANMTVLDLPNNSSWAKLIRVSARLGAGCSRTFYCYFMICSVLFC